MFTFMMGGVCINDSFHGVEIKMSENVRENMRGWLSPSDMVFTHPQCQLLAATYPHRVVGKRVKI